MQTPGYSLVSCPAWLDRHRASARRASILACVLFLPGMTTARQQKAKKKKK